MTSKNIELTRKEYDLIEKNRGIQEPQNMSTEELLNTLVDMIVNVKKRVIIENY